MHALYCSRGHDANALYASTICKNGMTLRKFKIKKRDLRKVPLKNPVAGLRGVWLKLNWVVLFPEPLSARVLLITYFLLRVLSI